MATENGSLSSKLNWLRAGVLGANDGVVSIAGIVMGVAGATSDSSTLLIAGLAGLVAGALSMAGGEYASVSSQRDTELATVRDVKTLLADDPDKLRAELTAEYERRGLEPAMAHCVAEALADHDPVAAYTEARHGISAHEQTSPWVAAVASIIAFTVGAVIPLLAMVLSPASVRIWVTITAVLITLVLTGSVSAYLGGANIARAVARNCLIGALGMGLTYLVGQLVAIPV